MEDLVIYVGFTYAIYIHRSTPYSTSENKVHYYVEFVLKSALYNPMST